MAEIGNLDALLVISRTTEGRRELAGIVPEIVVGITRFDPLLLHLRLLRNLCAGDDMNQSCFVDFGGPDRVAAALFPFQSVDITRAALQVLGNVALSGERHRAAVWDSFFPARFLELARVRNSGVVDALCMVLDTCCSSDAGRCRLRQLCNADSGFTILSEIVITASQVGYQEEWLEWLMLKVCIEEPFFSSLFINLSSNRDERSFTREQSFLLGLLLNQINEIDSISLDFSLSIFRLVDEASQAIDFSCGGDSLLPTGSPPVDILGCSICIIKELCAWEGPSSSPEDELAELFVSSGLLHLLLGLLHDLEPPSSIRKSMANTDKASVFNNNYSKLCPYKGFRRDVVAVIANISHRRKRIQDEIRKENCIIVMLQQCVVDENNPFLREWGLLAVRNLLEGNEENQREVSELELQEPVNVKDIEELGFKVEVDRKRRGVKLVNIS